MANILHLNENEFDALLIEKTTPILVDFWAEWCAPCRMLSPTIEELGEKYEGKADVVKINIDECKSLAQRYNILSIPTILIFQNSKVVNTQVGLRPIDEYSNVLDKLID